MIDQAAFLKLNEIFGYWLLVNKHLGEIESPKPISCIYQELISMSLKTGEIKILINYKYLKDRTGFGHESIRKALIELENFKLIKKGLRLGDNSFYIELKHDFWIKNFKGLL